MDKETRLEQLRQKLMKEAAIADFTYEKWLENEAEVAYMIEKITHQVVDDNYYAMKMEAFKEILKKDPNFKTE
jgi:hypothetical protein